MARDDMETHTSSFASSFLCFFDFRLSTFSHCASAGSPSGETTLESEVFSFFEGTDGGEEDRFMVVATGKWYWYGLSSRTCLSHPHLYDHGRWTYSLPLGLS